MPKTDEFADYLHDLLRPLGMIRLRRMFGGHGIYADELFFALVVDGQLYFKVDAQSRPLFEAAGLEEWVYEKDGKPVHMNYFRPPEAIYDDESELLHWGRLAQDAARRARKRVGNAPGKTAAPRDSEVTQQHGSAVSGSTKSRAPKARRPPDVAPETPPSPSLEPARRRQKTAGKSA